MTKRDKKKTKETFVELVGKFNAMESCCECHPHGEWDDCDYSPTSKSPCKKACSHLKFQKIVLRLLMEYMMLWHFVPITHSVVRKRKR